MSPPLRLYLTTLLACLLSALAVASTSAQDRGDQAPLKHPKISNTWKGSVPDADLLKSKPAPPYITNAKDFEALWKGWKLGDKVPEVDFKTEIVLVTTTTFGNLLEVQVTLNEQGNLSVPEAIAKADPQPGFRYIIISVKKDGVKSVNFKPLKE